MGDQKRDGLLQLAITPLKSERSTQNGRAKTFGGGGGGGGAHTNSELPQAGFPESLGKYC